MSAAPADPGALSRRRVLGTATLGLGGLAVAGLAAACGNVPVAPSSPPGTPAPSTSTSAAASAYSGDAQAAAQCAALATLVAALYGDAGTAAGQGRYGSVPGVVTALLTGAAGQHTAAATAWNQVLTAAGKPAVSGSPLTVEPAYRSRLGAATSPVDLLSLVLDLETTAGATITARLGEITDPTAVAVGAGVAPVTAMHAATASLLLGHLPSPPADPTAGALPRSTLTV